MRGGINIFLDAKYINKEVAKLGNWDAAISNWLDGKYPASKVVPAKKIGQDIIRRSLLKGRRATKLGRKNWVLLSVSHDTQILAVLKGLLGANPYALGFKTPKYNQGLKIFHTTKGKDILEVEGKRFDVTERLKEFEKKIRE